MRSEDLSVELRLRSPWEAVDLGFAMVRHWAGSVYVPWLSLILPLGVLLFLGLGPAWGCVVLWCLLPALDGLLLFVLSRSVFGVRLGLLATLRETSRTLPGLLLACLLMRMDAARAFHLPVRLLERLPRDRRRQRQALLDIDCHSEASVLSCACWLMVIGLSLAVLAAIQLMTPSTMQIDWGLAFERLVHGAAGSWLGWVLAASYLIAVAFIEPFHVAGGFALYLSRRTRLEGWDLEIAFRRMAERAVRQEGQRAAAASGRPMGTGIGLGLLLCMLVSGPALGQENVGAEILEPATQSESSEDPRVVAKRVMAEPEFGRKVKKRAWRLRHDGPSDSEFPPEWLLTLLGVLARCLLIALVGIALIAFVRWLSSRRGAASGQGAPVPLQSLSGLDLRPESLPADVPSEAESLWRNGSRAEALALLYRGALSCFITRDALTLRESYTEEDCLHVIMGRVGEKRSEYFHSLTRAWQAIAYAHAAPSEARGLALCTGWAKHFGGTP